MSELLNHEKYQAIAISLPLPTTPFGVYKQSGLICQTVHQKKQ